MTIMGKKREDGRYYVEGRIPQPNLRSGKPEDIFTSFLIDSSQRTTIISESEALKHEIEYKSFNLKKNAFSKNSRIFDAYEITDLEIIFASQDRHPYYREKFIRIFIPLEKTSYNNLEPSSVLGLDFLERFTIRFLRPEPTSGGIVLKKIKRPKL